MGQLLYDLLVAPLMLLYGEIFSRPLNLEVGARIVMFSVIINLILAPLYGQMERRSRAGREQRAAVTRDVERMKRHFRGRERYFYIRAVYRQHGYHPLSHLLSSADLLVQILVFSSVFHFLSGLPELRGAHFGPLRDLSQPDGLLGGINVLPFVMTAFNAAAVLSYVEDPARRVQALALSAVFLVVLYASPSGLVLYWTCNNLFSVVRNQLRESRARARPGAWTRWVNRWQAQR
jgi:membrane protein insertase Oxa1/YidC/SpoIIIJ